MRQIVYYYDPILKSEDNRWSVDVYISDGKKTFWEATVNGDTYSEVLCNVRNFVDNLNKTIALFGINETEIKRILIVREDEIKQKKAAAL